MDESVLGNAVGALINNRGNGSGFGEGGGLIWLIAILFMFGAWGGNGFGGRGGSNVATTSDVFGSAAWQNTQDAVSGVESAVRDVNQNVTSLGYNALAQSGEISRNIIREGADTRLQICQNKGEITNGLAALGYAVNNGQQNSERAIDQVRFDNAQQTCSITTNDTANTQKILDKLCTMEANAQQARINELESEKQALALRLGQSEQTAQIIGTLRPYPIPAYPTVSPYSGLPFGYGFGYGGYLGGYQGSYGNFN